MSTRESSLQPAGEAGLPGVQVEGPSTRRAPPPIPVEKLTNVGQLVTKEDGTSKRGPIIELPKTFSCEICNKVSSLENYLLATCRYWPCAGGEVLTGKIFI